MLFVLVFLLKQNRPNGEGWSTANQFKLFHYWPSQGGSSAFGSFVVLDLVCGYVLLFLLDIEIENR